MARGERLVQETRGWIETEGKTVSQRSKEYAHDYRYFPEPDLPPLVISREWVEAARAKLPELPEARRGRFMAEYGLNRYDAGLLTSSRATAEYFEACMSRPPQRWNPKEQANSEANAVTNLKIGEPSTLRGNSADGKLTLYGENASAISAVEISNTGANLQLIVTSGTADIQFTPTEYFGIMSGSVLLSPA